MFAWVVITLKMSVLLLTLTENLASPRLCASTSTSPPAAGAETAATPTCAAAAIPVPTPLRNAPSCSPATPTRPQDPATVARSKVEQQLHNHKPVVSSPIDHVAFLLEVSNWFAHYQTYIVIYSESERLNWIINVIFLVFNIKQVAWAWVLIIVVNDNYYFWFFKLETVWFTFIIHLMQRL